MYRGETCDECGMPVAYFTRSYWLAPDELWNRVTGGDGGVLCPPCFTVAARAARVNVHWEVVEGAWSKVPETATHPDVLSDEDGEQMWVREDLVPDGDPDTLRQTIAATFNLGSEEVDVYELDGLREMRRATDAEQDGVGQWQVDEGWYVPVLEGQTCDVRYWRLTI